MKFIDFFAGIGGFRRGMELEGHECVGFCEFDKFAVASYTSMHLITQEQREFLSKMPLKQRQKEILKEEYRNGEWYANDIRRVYAGDIPKADCWCFGFPCQDISVAGKQLGFQGNRSSLFFRVMYLIGQLEEENRPTYLFIENVKNLLSINGGWDFARLLIEMEQRGYDAEWQVLNSKDFGVPQNRERCFIIGHLRGRSTSKIFPIEGTDGKNSVSLNLFGCLNGRNSQRDRVYSGDGLAPTISTKPGGNTEPKVSILFDTSYIGQDGKARIYENICPTLTSKDYKEPRSVEVVCNVNPSGKGMNGRRFKEDGEPMFTLTGQDRHGIAIGVKEATKQGYAECRVGIDSVNFSMPNSKTRRGRVGRDVANTLDTSCNQGIFVQVSEELTVYATWYEKYQCCIAIRRLTPKECFRLQGWTDDYFEKAEFVNSDSQLYKQAGNGVTVNVIRAIAEKLENNEKN